MGQMLDEIMKNVNKANKEEIFTKGLSEYDYTRIPFTSPRMNYCTFGGLPVGKLIEFYGEEHGGKTTTALDIIANYQNMFPDKDVLFIDAENTLDVEWAKKIGVDVDKLYIIQPKSQSAEELFQIISDAVDSGEVGLWVLDSIGVLVSAQELDKTMEDKTYGGISKPLTLFAKRIEQLMQRHKCTGIGINQEREDMNSVYGGTTTPGGKAWKHCCAVRMRFRKGDYFDSKGNKLNRSAESPVGNVVMMSMTKNKTCPPTRRTGFYSINYEYGIDYLKDLIDVAVLYGVIDKHGAWFDIVNPETGEIIEGKLQGQAKVYEKLENDSDLLEKVESYVEKCMQE